MPRCGRSDTIAPVRTLAGDDGGSDGVFGAPVGFPRGDPDGHQTALLNGDVHGGGENQMRHLVTLFFLGLLVPASAVMAQEQRQEGPLAGGRSKRCYVYHYHQNTARVVPGPVNVECGNGPERCHTAPYGNWGVETVYQGRYDGHQFQGWFDDGKDPWLQWNSCTSLYPPDPDPQVTHGGVNTHATYTLRLPLGERSCSSLNNKTVTFHAEYMQLYELDSA